MSLYLRRPDNALVGPFDDLFLREIWRERDAKARQDDPYALEEVSDDALAGETVVPPEPSYLTDDEMARYREWTASAQSPT